MQANAEPAVAVNLALIPNTRWLEWCDAINALLPEDANNLVFGETSVPHVTLAMGVVPLKRLKELYAALPPVPEDLRLLPDEVAPQVHPDRTTWWLKVTPTEELMALQAEVARVLADFHTGPCTADHFAGEDISDRAVAYVNGFADAAYLPHITLGFGERLPMLPGMPATSKARLEAWHLGPNCTCFGRMWKGRPKD